MSDHLEYPQYSHETENSDQFASFTNDVIILKLLQQKGQVEWSYSNEVNNVISVTEKSLLVGTEAASENKLNCEECDADDVNVLGDNQECCRTNCLIFLEMMIV